MRHARPDYNERIIDTKNLIPEDEPVFFLRGQDKAAPQALLAWAEENTRLGGDFHLSQLARAQADEMRKWQERWGSKSADRPAEEESKKED